MVNKAMLRDEEGKIIAIYEKDEISYDLATSGTIKRVFSWDMSENPLESEFFAELSVKWDGCSHFWFKGEDYNSGDKDSYYHICGVYSYIDFMRTMVFAYEIMVKHVGEDRIDERTELKHLRALGLLEDCELIFE